jgi:hypothetical protein
MGKHQGQGEAGRWCLRSPSIYVVLPVATGVQLYSTPHPFLNVSIHEHHDLASSAHPGSAPSLIITAFKNETSLVGVQRTGVTNNTTRQSIEGSIDFLILLDIRSTYWCPLLRDERLD